MDDVDAELPAARTMAEWLRVVGEPNRLRILDLLMQGVWCNCELGEALDMAPNLISHHLGVLREAGLVRVERDVQDARWLYYSIDRQALAEIKAMFAAFFDPARIKSRQPDCGPRVNRCHTEETTLVES